MSTVLHFKQAPAETIDLLLARPELAVVFWTNPNYTRPKTHGFWLWLARLFGDYKVPSTLPEAPPELDRSGDDLRLDEDWQSLLPSDRPFLSFGEPIPGSDHGYGDDRVVRPPQVAELQQSLQKSNASDSERLTVFLDITIEETLGLAIKVS
ncbi:MAG: hypothetical protein AAF266_10710 [Planctomycetota bacterium]